MKIRNQISFSKIIKQEMIDFKFDQTVQDGESRFVWIEDDGFFRFCAFVVGVCWLLIEREDEKG